MMHAESLPAELWLEVFSYLHPRDNIRAFFNLNRFFDRFASTKYFGVHHNVRREHCTPNSSKSSAERLRLNTIRSIADGPNVPYYLLQYLCWNAEDLVQLRKISIYLRKGTLIQTGAHLADALHRLPLLKSIEIQSNVSQFDDCQIKDILITVFSERLALTHCRLLFSFEYLNLSLDQWSGPSSIRYLTIGKISWSNLLAILSQTRDLVYLNVAMIGSQCQPSTLILSSHREITMNIDMTPFALLTNVCQLAPQMNNFLVRGLFPIGDENYFREDFWRKLLGPISYYNISLGHWSYVEDQQERMRMIYASLLGNDWLEMFVDGYHMRVRLSFRSK